jgi:hypothetical protein
MELYLHQIEWPDDLPKPDNSSAAARPQTMDFGGKMQCLSTGTLSAGTQVVALVLCHNLICGSAGLPARSASACIFKVSRR